MSVSHDKPRTAVTKKLVAKKDAADHTDRAQQRVKIRAARLRLVTDRRLGKVTPAWVKDLAKKPV